MDRSPAAHRAGCEGRLRPGRRGWGAARLGILLGPHGTGHGVDLLGQQAFERFARGAQVVVYRGEDRLDGLGLARYAGDGRDHQVKAGAHSSQAFAGKQIADLLLR